MFQNIIQGLTPNIKSRAKVPAGAKSAALQLSESSAGLLSKNSSFLNP